MFLSYERWEVYTALNHWCLYITVLSTQNGYTVTAYGDPVKTLPWKLKPLKLLHKKIIPAMEEVHYTYATHELYVKLSMFKLKQIKSYMVGKFVYKCTRNREFAALLPRSTRSTEN